MGHKQFSTFFLNHRWYGIDVMSVQEITKALPVTKVPLAAEYIYGLINLRGQIVTAIGLKDLFKMDTPRKKDEDVMNVVCKGDHVLLSLQVDQIGDVVEIEEQHFEATPDTVAPEISRFMRGVYKTDQELLSILDVDKIVEVLNL